MVQPQSYARVDVANVGNPFAQREDGFVDHRQQDTIDDETGGIERLHDVLAQPLGIGFDRRDRFVRCCQPTDQLDQRHDLYGVEEVDAHEQRRIGHHLRQPGDGDGRGIGRQDRAGRDHRAHIGEDAALDLLPLGRGLDHQLRFGQRSQITARADAGKGGLGIFLAQLALFDRTGKLL